MEMTNIKIDEQDKELLRSQAHIWNHIFHFISSMSLKCAIQLGIPDTIHRHGGGPMALSDLVSALHVTPSKAQCVRRLMRILVRSGFFTTEKVKFHNFIEQEGYSLTPASRLLLKEEPFSVVPFLMAMLDPILTGPWHHVSEWFQNVDRTPFETTYGSTFWDYGGQEPRLNRFFNEGMASDARLVTSMVVKNCKGVFDGLSSLVDVGGGTGTVAKAVAEAFPGLKCTVLDLPHVVAGLKGSENLSFVGGDMFESIPSADAVLLKWILHDWSDEESVKILKQCKEAINSSKEKGGKLIIIDMKVVDCYKQNKGSELDDDDDDHEMIETQLFFDMLMMTLVTGRERTEQEWAQLFSDAGFSHYKINPVLGLRSLIEVYP